MSDAPSPKRTIVYHAPQDALGPMTEVILSRLGYRLLLPESFDRIRASDPQMTVDLLLVDERRLGEADAYEEDGEQSRPIVLLTGKHGATGADPRIIGAVKRPAGMHDLYRLMQQVFEDTPRSTPRIPTQIRATCVRGERNWDGRVLSLSGNGCLIRTVEAIPLGQHVQLEFDLPSAGPVSVDAEAAYQLLPDVGLVFNAVDPAQRETLERYVTQAILAA